MTKYERVPRITMTIPLGDAVSNGIPIHKNYGLAIAMPAAWTTASLGFEVSETAEADSWKLLRDEDGDPIVITVSVNSVQDAPVKSWALFSWPYFRLVSIDASGNHVNQDAARSFTVGFKE